VGKRLGISGRVSYLGCDVDAFFTEDAGDSVPDSCFVYDDVEGRVYLLETFDQGLEEDCLQLPVELVGVGYDVGKDGDDVSVSAFQ